MGQNQGAKCHHFPARLRATLGHQLFMPGTFPLLSTQPSSGSAAACALPCCALAKGASPVPFPPSSCSRGFFLLVPVDLEEKKIRVRLPGHLLCHHQSLLPQATTTATLPWTHLCLAGLRGPGAEPGPLDTLALDSLCTLATAPLLLWCLPCLMAQRKIVTAPVCPCTTDYPYIALPTQSASSELVRHWGIFKQEIRLKNKIINLKRGGNLSCVMSQKYHNEEE